MQKLTFDLYQNRSRVLAEAYDALIAQLYLDSRGAPPKTICIAGLERGVGKTTVAVNLAIALSLTGKRVVLLDCDSRKEPGEKRLQANLLLGLSDYLSGRADYEEILTETNYPFLTLIPCGNIEKQKTASLFYSPNFGELLENIQKAYDFVIFDTPPWTAGADAAIVASKCAGTFFIAEINKTRKEDLKKALDQCNNLGAPLLGVLLNKIKAKDYKFLRR